LAPNDRFLAQQRAAPASSRDYARTRASVLISNVFGEAVRWVVLEGSVTIHEDNGPATAEGLLSRYVDDLDSPLRREALKLLRWVERRARRATTGSGTDPDDAEIHAWK
jgi:hypothetical protein